MLPLHCVCPAKSISFDQQNLSSNPNSAQFFAALAKNYTFNVPSRINFAQPLLFAFSRNRAVRRRDLLLHLATRASCFISSSAFKRGCAQSRKFPPFSFLAVAPVRPVCLARPISTALQCLLRAGSLSYIYRFRNKTWQKVARGGRGKEAVGILLLFWRHKYSFRCLLIEYISRSRLAISPLYLATSPLELFRLIRSTVD